MKSWDKVKHRGLTRVNQNISPEELERINHLFESVDEPFCKERSPKVDVEKFKDRQARFDCTNVLTATDEKWLKSVLCRQNFKKPIHKLVAF